MRFVFGGSFALSAAFLTLTPVVGAAEPPPPTATVPLEAAPAPGTPAVVSPPAEVAPEAAPAPLAPAPQPEPAPNLPPPALEPAPEPIAEAPLPPEPEDEPDSWYDGFKFVAFADAYLNYDFNFPKAPDQARSNPLRAYDTRQGFGIAWAGLDIAKDAEPVGGQISLRFGPTADRIARSCVDGTNCDSAIGLSWLKQAYATFRPGGKEGPFSVDLGKFDTPYGAEVAEAQYNLNYTRGALYWLGQPLFHTGLRVNIDPVRQLNIKLLAVNGWNRSVDNNTGKTFGLQGTFRLPKTEEPDQDLLTVAAGYMFGPEHGDTATVVCPAGQSFDPTTLTGCRADAASQGNSGVIDRGASNTKGMRHFVDLTVTANPVQPLKLLFNASLGIDNDRDPQRPGNFVSSSWFGLMLAGRYAVHEQVGLAGRFEYYADPDGYTSGFAGNDVSIVTGTLTADYSPASSVKFFLDGRLDWANRKIFPKGVRDPNIGTAVSTTVGAVFTTN